MEKRNRGKSGLWRWCAWDCLWHFPWQCAGLVGKPMLQFVSQPEQFRAWVDSHGFWGRLAFLGMVAFR